MHKLFGLKFYASIVGLWNKLRIGLKLYSSIVVLWNKLKIKFKLVFNCDPNVPKYTNLNLPLKY